MFASRPLKAFSIVCAISMTSLGAIAQSQDEDIETVTVYGQRTLPYIQKQIQKTQMKFYDELNALNTISKFDLICERKSAKGSRIVKRSCEPRFLKDTRAQLVQDNLTRRGKRGLTNLPTKEELKMATKEDQIAYQKHIQSILLANEGVRETFVDLQNLVAKYQKRTAGNN